MKQKRLQALDLIKILAMFMVMTLHTCMHKMSAPIAFVVYFLSAIAIPLFFMVSGYLQGNRSVDARYILRKTGRILKFCFIITTGLFLIQGVLYHADSISNYWHSFPGCFLQDGYCGQLWFLGAMCIIYVLLPTLIWGGQHWTYFYEKIFILLVSISSVVFILNITCGIEHGIPQVFRIYNSLMYFIAGALVRKYEDRLKMLIANGLFLIVSTIMFLFLTFSLRNSMGYPAFADRMFGSVNCMLYAGILFVYIASKKVNCKWIGLMSDIFLPCYVIHFIVIGHVLNFIQRIGLDSQWYSIIIELVIVYSLSCLISLALMRIPYINKIFRI